MVAGVHLARRAAGDDQPLRLAGGHLAGRAAGALRQDRDQGTAAVQPMAGDPIRRRSSKRARPPLPTPSASAPPWTMSIGWDCRTSPGTSTNCCNTPRSNSRRSRVCGSSAPREKVAVISVVLKDLRTEEVGRLLDQEGIAVRAGHHCAQPSLRRFGLELTVRPSFSLYNTKEEIDRLVAAVKRIAKLSGCPKDRRVWSSATKTHQFPAFCGGSSLHSTTPYGLLSDFPDNLWLAGGQKRAEPVQGSALSIFHACQRLPS